MKKGVNLNTDIGIILLDCDRIIYKEKSDGTVVAIGNHPIKGRIEVRDTRNNFKTYIRNICAAESNI